MARREYYNDPQAPVPNSLVVATSAVVTDDAGRILLQRRTDSGNWALPGGGMEMNESLADSVVREVKEETGLDVEVTGLVGTYTDPRHIIAYTDGEVRRQFNIWHTAPGLSRPRFRVSIAAPVAAAAVVTPRHRRPAGHQRRVHRTPLHRSRRTRQHPHAPHAATPGRPLPEVL